MMVEWAREREHNSRKQKKIAFNHATVYNVLCIVLCAWNIDFCRFNSPNCEWKMVTYYWIFPPAFVVVIGAGLMQSILSFFFIFILRFLHHWPCDWSIGINRWPKREHKHAHGLQSSTVAQFCLIIFPTITGVGMYFFLSISPNNFSSRNIQLNYSKSYKITMRNLTQFHSIVFYFFSVARVHCDTWQGQFSRTRSSHCSIIIWFSTRDCFRRHCTARSTESHRGLTEILDSSCAKMLSQNRTQTPHIQPISLSHSLDSIQKSIREAIGLCHFPLRRHSIRCHIICWINHEDGTDVTGSRLYADELCQSESI